MFKRLLLIVVLLACAGYIFFVFRKLHLERTRAGDPFQTVLPRAEMILELDAGIESPFIAAVKENLSISIKAGSDSAKSLSPLYFGQRLYDRFISGDTLPETEHIPLVFSWIENEVCIATGLNGANAAQIISDLFPGEKFVSRKFRGAEIMQSTISDLNYTELKNVLVISTASSLVEETILGAEKETEAPVLLQKARAMSSADATFHLYCNLGNNEWLQLDPQITESSFLLAGYVLLDENSENRMALMGTAPAIETAVALPSGVSVSEIYCYPSFEEGWKKSEYFFANSNRSKFWSQAWKDFGDSCQCDLNEVMLSWRGNFCGSFLVEDGSDQKPVLFYSVRDSIDVLKIMQPLVREFNNDEAGIVNFSYPQLWDRNNNSSLLVAPNFVMQIGNQLFLAEDADVLRLVRQASTQAVACSGSYSLMQQEPVVNVLHGKLQSILHEAGLNKLSVSHFRENKYLVTASHEVVSDALPVAILNAAEPDHGSATTGAATGSWKLKNHRTGETEFLVQNSSHHISLHENDESGKILWKLDFREAIVGDVVQIDAYNNGRLQMLFLTSRAIHCLDRNGNNVPGFPIVLPSDASSTLAVFDYDGSKNYRIVVGCDNKKIYNYTVECKQALGWNPPQFKSQLSSIHHIQIQDNDYLVALLYDRSIHVLKRTGTEIYRAEEKLPENFMIMEVSMLPGNSIESSSIILRDGGLHELTIGLKK